MKNRIFSLILSLVIILTFSVAFTSCNIKKTDKEIKIGIAAPKATHGWIAGVTYYAEKYCKEHSITYKIVTSSNADEMTAGINELVSWGADAIITYPQWTGMEPTIQSVIDKEITVVAFDMDIDVDGVYMVTGDNYQIGFETAKYLVSRVGASANIIVMDVPTSGIVNELRKQGFYAYLDEIGYDKTNITEVANASCARQNGYENFKKLIEENTKIDAVFSYDDELSLGCVQAIEETGYKGIKAITGGGGMQEYFRLIKDEKYSDLGLSTGLYSPSMIADAISAALRIVKGEEVEQNIIIPTAVVTKDNVDEYLDSANVVY